MKVLCWHGKNDTRCDTVPRPINMGSLVQKGLTIRSGQTHVKRYLEPLTKLIQDGKIDASSVITHRSIKFGDGPDLYCFFKEKKDGCVKVVFHRNRTEPACRPEQARAKPHVPPFTACRGYPVHRVPSGSGGTCPVAAGGGLGLYDGSGLKGGLGVSRDISCADHTVAWRVRQALGMDKVPAGPGTLKTDGIVYDTGVAGSSSSGFGHPKCAAKQADVATEIGAGSAGLLAR